MFCGAELGCGVLMKGGRNDVMQESAQGRAGGRASRARNAPVGLDDAEILRRGLDTFAELGYDATTVRELAKRLDVSHNFVNDRYGSKAGFWRAVIDFALGDLTAQADASFETDGDDAERLVIVVNRFFRLAANSPQVNRIMADEAVRDSDRLDYLYDNFISVFWGRLRPIVERLMESGRISRVPIHLVFVALYSAAMSLTHDEMARRLVRAADGTSLDADTMAETLAGIVLGGLLPTFRDGGSAER